RLRRLPGDRALAPPAERPLSRRAHGRPAEASESRASRRFCDKLLSHAPKDARSRRTASVTESSKKKSCAWSVRDPMMLAYHDEEWGVPVRDDRALFEKLLLDGFQAGLSWSTILHKRDAYRKLYGGFDPVKIARWRPAKIESLMKDARIIRNRQKI